MSKFINMWIDINATVSEELLAKLQTTQHSDTYTIVAKPRVKDGLYQYLYEYQLYPTTQELLNEYLKPPKNVPAWKQLDKQYYKRNRK
jgi:hypothetical protein